MDRTLTPVDRLLDGVQNALGTVLGSTRAERPNPAGDRADVVLDDTERRHAAGLMRINHVGEVCAQALYVGQALVARDAATREQLLHAAQEETDHLAWCADRLRELDTGFGCCGAAGTQMATDPVRAAQFRAPLLAQLAASGATRLLSANIGCRLHFANSAAVPVQHPLEFLAALLP
jgi:hypothetical protein